MGWILSLLGFLVKLWRGAPDPKVVEGEKLGAATQAEQQESQTNDQVAQAVAASRAADAVAAANPDSLRAPDADSRD